MLWREGAHLCDLQDVIPVEESLPKAGPSRRLHFKKIASDPEFLSGEDLLTSVLSCHDTSLVYLSISLLSASPFQIYLLLVSLVGIALTCSPGFVTQRILFGLAFHAPF